MWPHFLTAILGIWLMSASVVLGYGGPAQTNDHVIGSLIASFAIIACSQVTRGLRWGNVLFGIGCSPRPGCSAVANRAQPPTACLLARRSEHFRSSKAS